MNGELLRPDRLLVTGLPDEALSKYCRFQAGEHPANHIVAENVQDHEIEVTPLDGPKKFGDIPWSDLVRGRGQEFGFGIGWVTELVSPLPDLTFLLEHTVHGSNRAQIAAFIEQDGVDLVGGLSHEPFTVHEGQNFFSFLGA